MDEAVERLDPLGPTTKHYHDESINNREIEERISMYL